MTVRLLTAGESHGPALVVIVDGFPAGIPLEPADVERQLGRRQRGHGRGPRAAGTVERVRIVGGVRGGLTTGAPVAIELDNPEPGPGRAGPAAPPPAPPVPRAGHADLAAACKFGSPDFWPHVERASARETAARVAGACVARALLAALGVEVGSCVVSLGGVCSPESDPWVLASLDAEGWRALWAAAEASPVRCPDPGASGAMVAAVDEATASGDTLGGRFVVAALGCPPGLGSFSEWDRRLDARLAAAVMSVPGVRGVGLGLGFDAATLPGSRVHDRVSPGRGPFGTSRPTNRAGGIEGGLTNGEPVVVLGAMKPIPSLGTPPASVDLASGEVRIAPRVRGDVCAVPAAAVVAEAMVAWELAAAALERFGGDTLEATLGAAARSAAWAGSGGRAADGGGVSQR